MCCTTLTASVHEKHETEFHLVRVNWIVLIDAKGNRRPQMRWHTD
jgi:hypothetical protein